MSTTRHVPVLLHEVLRSLDVRPGMNVIDCTLGDGGHASELLRANAPNGMLLGIDADPESLMRAKQYLYTVKERLVPVRDNFSRLKSIVEETSFGPVHAILIDLGWSSPQFADRGRGFSFQNDEPLDMRYTNSSGITAAELIANEDVETLTKIFHDYGEEQWSGEIAHAIVETRAKMPIKRTNQLVEIILTVYRQKLRSTKEIPWVGGLHPATKVFQALRIAVNRELQVIEDVLPQAVDILAPGGRLAVITFHSLEDRIVKHYFKRHDGKTIRLIQKKPLVAGKEEYDANPPSRSAKLRVVEKI